MAPRAKQSRHLPESPRWLLLHGHEDAARAVVADIEERVANGGALPEPGRPAWIEAAGAAGLSSIARTLLRRYPRRAVLGFVLMVSQAFLYNGVFFTYALVLGRFFGVASSDVGLYLLPFAAGNLFGPILLGPLFDSIGRRWMITLTYAGSGLLLALSGYALARGWLTAASQTALWSAVFFVASAAASSAYLTVSELFPVELRGLAIALFYAVGTAAGGLAAPAVFGALISTGTRTAVFGGYLFAGALMGVGALVSALLAVPAERKSLEHLAELADGASSTVQR
jgi:MFS family permease